MSGDNIYLHGFKLDGQSVGQTGPYAPDAVSAIEKGGQALKRMGARRIVRVEAADPAEAAVRAEESLSESADVPQEPWSARDRVGRVVAAVSVKMSEARARRRAQRRGQ